MGYQGFGQLLQGHCRVVLTDALNLIVSEPRDD